MDYHAILNIGIFTDKKWRTFISPNGSTGGYEDIGSNIDIANDVGKGVHIGGVVNFGFGKTF
jgi:hypothetical protein